MGTILEESAEDRRGRGRLFRADEPARGHELGFSVGLLLRGMPIR